MSGGPVRNISPSHPVSSGIALVPRQDGTQYPLFVFSSESCQAEFIPALAASMDADAAIYVLNCSAAAYRELRTVEGIATALSRNIRSIQRSGPYFLLGIGSSGLLAYETAVQLLGDDGQVAFLGLLQTYPSYRKDRQKSVEEQSLHHQQSSCSPMEHSRALLLHIPDHLHSEIAHEAIVGYAPRVIAGPVDLFSLTDDIGPEWKSRIRSGRFREHRLDTENLATEFGRHVSDALHTAICTPVDLPEPSYSPLVPLQKGANGKEVLVCIPGAGASSTAFLDLIKFLPESWPVIGLQPRGLQGDLVPHSTVEAAARHYIRSLRDVVDRKIVHLVAHSFGGWIAFEMAERWLAGGFSVGSLTIIDSSPPTDKNLTVEYTETEVILRWLETVEQGLERSLGVMPADVEMLDEERRLAFVHSLLVREGVMHRSTSLDVLLGPLRAFATSLRTPYIPSAPYTQPVHLILASDVGANNDTQRPGRQMLDPWRRWAPHLVCSIADGNHMTILKSPRVQLLAALIRESMSANRI